MTAQPQARPSLTDLLDEASAARAYSLALVDGLTEDQVQWRPNDNSSAIAWPLGHQAAVTHYMVRNLTAAAPRVDDAFDAVFDSATEEPHRGDLPPLAEIVEYRNTIADQATATLQRIIGGEVGAPQQLALIADGLLRAVINHEYQHATWVAEVRATMIDDPAPTPASSRLVDVEGYWMIRPDGLI